MVVVALFIFVMAVFIFVMAVFIFVMAVFVMVVVASMVIMPLMTVTCHDEMELEVGWMCEPIFALSIYVEHHVAHRWVFPSIHLFDKVLQFTHVEHSVVIHIRFIEHFHENFFLMRIMVFFAMTGAGSAGCSGPHQSCSFAVCLVGVTVVNGVG